LLLPVEKRILIYMEQTTAYKYIVRKKESGEPMIQGTRIAVRDIVEEWKLGSSPEEIPFHYPHVTLAQVFEALAFYQDHMGEIEAFVGKNRVTGELHGKALPR